MIRQPLDVRRSPGENGHAARDATWCSALNREPTERAVAQLIEHALKVEASDVFLSSDADSVVVSIRRMGTVQHIGR